MNVAALIHGASVPTGTVACILIAGSDLRHRWPAHLSAAPEPASAPVAVAARCRPLSWNARDQMRCRRQMHHRVCARNLIAAAKLQIRAAGRLGGTEHEKSGERAPPLAAATPDVTYLHVRGSRFSVSDRRRAIAARTISHANMFAFLSTLSRGHQIAALSQSKPPPMSAFPRPTVRLKC